MLSYLDTWQLIIYTKNSEFMYMTRENESLFMYINCLNINFVDNNNET